MSWQPYAARPDSTVTGTLLQWEGVADEHHAARTLLAWLPPSYAAEPGRRYPAVYFHDGQNVFDEGPTFAGESWDAAGAAQALADAGFEEIRVEVAPEGGSGRRGLAVERNRGRALRT